MFHFLVISSSGDSLNLSLFACNGLFFLVLILEETAKSGSLFRVLKASRIFQSLLHRVLGQSMRNMSGVPLERFVTVQPRCLAVPGVLTHWQFCTQWLVSKHWHDWWSTGGPQWGQMRWRMKLFSERNVHQPQGESSGCVDSESWVSPSWQWDLGMVIYKRAWSGEAEKSNGNKVFFESFWFLEETRLGRSHPQSAHLWFSVSLSFLPPPITPFIPWTVSTGSKGEERHPIHGFSQSGLQKTGTALKEGSPLVPLQGCYTARPTVHEHASCLVPRPWRSFILKPVFSNGNVNMEKRISHCKSRWLCTLQLKKKKNYIKLICSYNEFLSFPHTRLFHNSYT